MNKKYFGCNSLEDTKMARGYYQLKSWWKDIFFKQKKKLDLLKKKSS
jgi:hypothetical protein